MRVKFYLCNILLFALSGCDSKSKAQLIDNFEKKTAELMAVKSHFKKIVPEQFKVRIRYDSPKEIDLIVYKTIQDKNDYELLFREWGVDIEKNENYRGNSEYSNSFLSVKSKLGWTNKTIINLHEKLKAANCIGVSNWDPVKIEYGYNGSGVYSYLIFNEILTKEQEEEYTDGCNYIIYKDNVVLNYEGGAIGMECFEGNNSK